MKRPKFLSRWADEHGIPRRTAYDRFHKGQLEVKTARLPSGSIVVLEGQEDDADTAHPFSVAYAEALGLPLQSMRGHVDYSALLEAWGCSLYENVATGLRPLVLGLASSAASNSGAADSSMGWRLLDFIAHVDLPAWYRAAGAKEAAAMLEVRGEITDQESFDHLWPTGVHSHQWRETLDEVASRVREEASARPAPRAVASLAGERFALELTEILPERLASVRNQHSRDQANQALREALDEAIDLGEESSIRLQLFDIRPCYYDAVAAMGVDLCREAARASLRVAGWEAAAGRPPSGHRATQIAYEAVIEAERTALAPERLASLLREITAYHCIATGQPLERR